MDRKFMSWASLKVKFSTRWMTSLRKERDKQQIGRKSLQNACLIKDWYSKYPENFWNSPKRKQKPNYKWAGYLNTYPTKEDMQIANKSMRRCSISYVIRESQLKTKRRHHYVPIKMVKIQGAHKHQMLVRLWSNKTFSFVADGIAKWSSYFERMRVSYKMKRALNISSSNHTPRCYPNEKKTSVHRKSCRWTFPAAFSWLPKLESERTFFNRWKDMQTVVHLDNGILFHNKRKWTIKPQKDTEET